MRDDPARNIWIRDELTMPLQLQVAYNDRQIHFRYRWPAAQPHLFTGMLRYSEGRWQKAAPTSCGAGDPASVAPH